MSSVKLKASDPKSKEKSISNKASKDSIGLQLDLRSAKKVRYCCKPKATNNNVVNCSTSSTTEQAAIKVQQSIEDQNFICSPVDVPDTEFNESSHSASYGIGMVGMKRIRSDDEDDDLKAPPLKRFKRFVCRVGRGMKNAMTDICSSTKNAVKHPQKMAKEVRAYSVKMKDDFTDAAGEILLPTSKQKLVESEKNVLSDMKTKGRVEDIVVEDSGNDKVVIHTITFDSTDSDNSSQFPLVLIHGYAGGLACFHRNFSSLCKKRRVYAIDLPGFALSSRIKFPDTPLDCKERIVALVEKWREAMKLEKFILLGHSFGGYISASYTIKYKERVRHLILAESWGILGRNEDPRKVGHFEDLVIMLELNPYEFVRKSMALGYYLHEKFMPKDIRRAYGDKIVHYFYHANAQPKATGEEAFAVISDDFLWPHNPLKEDLSTLDQSVPITILYGKNSKFKNDGGKDIKRKRKNVFLPAALKTSHHIQAEDPDGFNKKINEVCDMVDANADKGNP